MQNDAISQCYGVLILISQSYSPVKGRLHTCYAPVRRSPAMYCYTLLPLDLHVLGLPLAFILSQDQTLHCINCFSLLFYIRRVNVCCRAWFNSNTLSNSYSLIFGYSFLSKNGYINMTQISAVSGFLPHLQ